MGFFSGGSIGNVIESVLFDPKPGRGLKEVEKFFGSDEVEDEAGEGLSTTAKTFEEIAAEEWAIYKEYYAPFEIETMKAKSEFLPEFTRQTKEGIDVGKRQDEAGAEVMAQTKLGAGRLRREISRYGIDPSSSTYRNVANIQEIETSKAVAGARTHAKTQAESEQYARLGTFLDKPTPDPYARTIQAYSGAAGSYTALANQVVQPSDTSRLFGLIGGGVGAAFGGPSGAAVGYGIGSQLVQ